MIPAPGAVFSSQKRRCFPQERPEKTTIPTRNRRMTEVVFRRGMSGISFLFLQEAAGSHQELFENFLTGIRLL